MCYLYLIYFIYWLYNNFIKNIIILIKVNKFIQLKTNFLIINFNFLIK